MGNKEVPPTIDIAMAANHGDSLTLTPWQVKWLDDWQSTTLVQFARFERIEQAAKKLITCLPFADNEVGHKETADGMRDAITELERLESFQGCDGCSTGDCPHDNVNDCVQSQATTIAAQDAELERLRGVEESKDDEIARYEEAMQQAAQAVYDELAPDFGEVVAKAGYHAVKTLHREAAEQAGG